MQDKTPKKKTIYQFADPVRQAEHEKNLEEVTRLFDRHANGEITLEQLQSEIVAPFKTTPPKADSDQLFDE